MCVGFLYTVVVILSFLSMRMSRNDSFLLFSFSSVTFLKILCVVRMSHNEDVPTEGHNYEETSRGKDILK